MKNIANSFDGFSLAGLFTRLRRNGSPTRAFAPSKAKDKMIIVVDGPEAAEGLERLRHPLARTLGAEYVHVEAEVYIRQDCKAG